MQNLNGNLLCSIDVETTGTEVGKHDIIQIAILPLDEGIEVSKKIQPFIMELIPGRKENIDSEAMRINRMKLCEIMVRGVDSFRAADLFLEWFERLKLGYEKKIVPLGCNWPFDASFIREWLGPETYKMCFHYFYRDVQVVANFCNDRAGWMGRDFPYPKVSLQYLCNVLGVEHDRAHDAIDDARATAEVYRRIIKDFV